MVWFEVQAGISCGRQGRLVTPALFVLEGQGLAPSLGFCDHSTGRQSLVIKALSPSQTCILQWCAHVRKCLLGKAICKFLGKWNFNYFTINCQAFKKLLPQPLLQISCSKSKHFAFYHFLSSIAQHFGERWQFCCPFL